MFTRLRQPSWSTAVAGWSSIRILSPSQWGWSCSLGWCPAQQPAPSLPSHATPDTARNSRHQWPHGSGQCCSLSLISWRFSLSQLLQGSLKRLYESQLGSNDVPVTVCRSGAQSNAVLKMSEEKKLRIVSTLEPSTSFFSPPPTSPPLRHLQHPITVTAISHN